MNQLRVMLLVDQLPQDPASGAARTCKTICEYLAAAPEKFSVCALGTTATEKGTKLDVSTQLNLLGIQPQQTSLDGKDGCPILNFQHKAVEYWLLQSTIAKNTAWEPRHGKDFDQLFDQVLDDFRPDIVFTYGGHRNMVLRWRRVRATGAKIVFGLWNHGYLASRRFFDEVDSVLTPSEFLTGKYRDKLGIESTPLPTPIDLEDVVATEREPIFLTYVNPAIDKGVMFMARFAQSLAKQRPDIPLLVIESRGTAGGLVAAGLNGGFDLRVHENIMVSPGVPRPRDFFAVTRVLLVPSVWEEPSGRVASESLVNGIPPIVSNRGGLPEECRGAGIVLPLPDDLNVETRIPVSPEAVQPWIDAAVGLVDDEKAYQSACQSAKQAGSTYLPTILAERYVEFFELAAQS